MLGTHLRRNLVAYLALLVALTTGSAYAAQELPKKLPKHSVGSKQLKKNAVSSPKVKNGSLSGDDLADGTVGAADLAPGVVPGAAWVGSSGATNPHANPDVASVGAYSFVLPRAGTLLAVTDIPEASGTCTSGSMVAGLYLDGQPVPGSGQVLIAPAIPRTLAGVLVVAAGTHTVAIGADCASGNVSAYTLLAAPFRLVLGQ